MHTVHFYRSVFITLHNTVTWAVYCIVSTVRSIYCCYKYLCIPKSHWHSVILSRQGIRCYHSIVENTLWRATKGDDWYLLSVMISVCRWRWHKPVILLGRLLKKWRRVIRCVMCVLCSVMCNMFCFVYVHVVHVCVTCTCMLHSCICVCLLHIVILSVPNCRMTGSSNTREWYPGLTSKLLLVLTNVDYNTMDPCVL